MHPEFGRAVGDFLAREGADTGLYIDELNDRRPFKRSVPSRIESRRFVDTSTRARLEPELRTSKSQYTAGFRAQGAEPVQRGRRKERLSRRWLDFGPIVVASLIAAATPSKAQPTTSSLRHFTEAAGGTSAIGFELGARFVGPGALSFGRLGARRQIVLPEGEWVALAGIDWQAPLMSSQTIAGVQASLSTVVFGRFDGVRLMTMLRYTANTRPPPTLTTGAIGSTWADVERCDAPAPTRLVHERRQPDPFREDCLSIGLLPDPLGETWQGNPEARRNLARLGGAASGSAIITTLSFSEMRRYGYLAVVRVDWPESDMASEAARKAAVESAERWAADYRKAALDGYRNDYAGKAPTLVR